MREFYAFGSLCRGEPDAGSDLDILVITDQANATKEIPQGWSKYSPMRVRELFARGTLFAWHLYLEAVPLWPRNGQGFVLRVGPPSHYKSARREIRDLRRILIGALAELSRGTPSEVYEFGLVALACRDIAMAASLTINGSFNFSRHAPLRLKQTPFPLTKAKWDYLLACRRATTRGGSFLRNRRTERHIVAEAENLLNWSSKIFDRITQ
jgi:hypothetical protein